VTVHHERRMKREKPTRCNQSGVYYQTSISTCFGHQYAHHQENKTLYYRIWCSGLVLAVVVWSCVVNCVHCVKVTVGCSCVELRRELCALCEGYCWLWLCGPAS